MSCVLDNIRVVLTAPIYGRNVGAVCRAMANMGLSDLVIADPEPIEMNDALQMACSGGASVFNNRRETATLAEAVGDCVTVAGATAREGLYRSHAHTPRQAAPRLLNAAANSKVALVFGRETHGLSNAELALCTDIIRIPTGTVESSLNLAQAAMVCFYELFTTNADFEAPQEASPPAPSELRERMLAIWQEALLAAGFMHRRKAMHIMLGLRRIFSRGTLSINDVRILMGVARRMLWCATHGNREPDQPPGAWIDTCHTIDDNTTI